MKVSQYQWLYNLLGVDTSDIPPDANSEIIWQNLPQSWQWFALIGILAVAAYIVFWLYRREMNSAPTWAKIVMAALRMGVLLALVVLALSPALVYTKKDVVRPSVVVLRDDSQSMLHADSYLDSQLAERIAKVLGVSASEVQARKPTRVELVQKAAEADDRSFIRELEYRGKLKLIDFSASASQVGSIRPYRAQVDAADQADQSSPPSADHQGQLQRSRLLAGLALGLAALAAAIGFAGWYSSGALSPAAKWGVAGAAILLLAAAAATAGFNAVANPNVHVAEIFGAEAPKKKDARPGNKQPGADAAGDRAVQPFPPQLAQGLGTDIYRALAEALRDEHTAGIVLISDGQHTSKEQGTDKILALARQEKKAPSERIPIFTVGVGDPVRPRNVSLADIYANPRAFPNRELVVKVSVRGQDVGDTPVTVELAEQKLNADGSPAGEPKVLETRRDQVIPDSGPLDLPFKVQTGQPGLYGYTARVLPIENESNLEDNQPQAPLVVKVIEEKAKVLLVAGAPTWEYRMVQRQLTQDETVDLSCWLQTLDENRAQEGDEGTVITQLPIEKKDLFNYDVILLFDPDPIEFDENWINLLKEFTGDHGGGVLYMAGPKFTGQFLGGPRTNAVCDVLPVRLGDTQRIAVDMMQRSNTRAFPLDVVEANVDHGIMSFMSDPAESLEQWKRMPGLYWSFTPEEAKPAARVLIQHEDERGTKPILVAGQYGMGRTVYMGFNGTWRWRKIGHNAEFFKKFWDQTTKYLIEGRSTEGQRRGYVETKDRYQLGEKVDIVVRDLKDENFNLYSLSRAEIQVTVQPEGGGQPSTVTCRKGSEEDRDFHGSYTPRAIGKHVVKVIMPEGAGTPPKIETTFSVIRPTIETNDVALNKPLLVDIASVSNGAYFDIDELQKVPPRIPPKTKESEYRSKPRLLWDTNRMLLLLVALLTGEWALRKGFKLL